MLPSVSTAMPCGRLLVAARSRRTARDLVAIGVQVHDAVLVGVGHPVPAGAVERDLVRPAERLGRRRLILRRKSPLALNTSIRLFSLSVT